MLGQSSWTRFVLCPQFLVDFPQNFSLTLSLSVTIPTPLNVTVHSFEEQSWGVREVCRAVGLNGFWGLRTNTIHLSVYSCKHSALMSEGLLVPLKNLFSQHHWEKGFHGFNFSISRNLRNWAIELLLSTRLLSMGIVKRLPDEINELESVPRILFPSYASVFQEL